MNKPTELFGLYCPDGRQAQLLSVQVHVEILGLMLRLSVRQTWRNASGAPMATRMRLPLAWDETLLALEIERTGHTQALRTVSRESRTHCSATPGLLATGEQVTLHWRAAQLLNLQGGSLRLSLPAGLVPATARSSELHIEVHDPVAQGTVGCTSHNMARVRHANGLTLRWRSAQGLGKDLLLTAYGLRDSALAVAAPLKDESDACALLVSACPRLHSLPAPGRALRLKLLVDSSSTMPTERLSQIRHALDRVLEDLQPLDELSYSRYGERTVHDLPRLQVCTEAYLRRLRALARHTNADFGPAHAVAAVQSVLAITDEDEEAVNDADILLITANPIWRMDPLLQALRSSQHRLHVLAVGHGAEGLWRELAQATGGNCESLGYGQHSLQALMRMFERLRQQRPVQARLTLRGAEADAAWIDTTLADGDTVHLWAQVRSEPSTHDLTGQPSLQAGIEWDETNSGSPAQSLEASQVLWDECGDLLRLQAALRLSGLDEAAQAQHIEQYRLIVPDAQRMAMAQPSLASLAAQTAQTHTPASQALTPAAASAEKHTASPSPLRTVHSPEATIEIKPTLRKTAVPPLDLAGCLAQPRSADHPLGKLVSCFNAQAAQRMQYRSALSATLQAVSTRWLDGLVLQLARQAGSPAKVWAMVFDWLEKDHDWTLSAPAKAVLASELANVPVTVRNNTLAELRQAALSQTMRQAA